MGPPIKLILGFRFAVCFGPVKLATGSSGFLLLFGASFLKKDKLGVVLNQYLSRGRGKLRPGGEPDCSGMTINFLNVIYKVFTLRLLAV
jgi:hypothetical protein